MTQADNKFSRQFRFAAPYIRAHRNRTFVVGIPGDALVSDNFQDLAHDLALLTCLGIRLVLVHGARTQIEGKLREAGFESHLHQEVRVTPADQLEVICSAIAEAQRQLMRAFSAGMANTPGFGLQTALVSGNYISARPIGVRQGVDYQYTGQVRSVNASRIIAALDTGAVVLVSTLGYSITGEIFNLALDEVTGEVAKALRADKLICFSTAARLAQLHRENQTVYNVLQLEHALAEQGDTESLVNAALKAVSDGVPRAHIIDYEMDGALLEELFTPMGAGLMIVERDVEQVRVARPEDIGGIMEITLPLVQMGQLVQRDRDLMERQIDNFRVIDIDGRILCCAALFVYETEQVGELACLATHPQFRGQGRATRLVKHIEHWAQSLGLKRLVSLTTEGQHWFIEQGYRAGDVSDLPPERQKTYNNGRASRVFIKDLK